MTTFDRQVADREVTRTMKGCMAFLTGVALIALVIMILL